MVVEFPPVETADDSGLLAIGGDLRVATLELAYRNGTFPWPHRGFPLLWFAPPERAILEFREVHISRRLRRYLRKMDYTFRTDTAFEQVIRACADSSHRRNQPGTWITPAMIEAYTRFHRAGFAHSFEAFNRHGELVAGLYGVWINKYFAGESMFCRESNASKLVLIETVRHLQRAGLTWMDVQVMSPLLRSLGAKEIPRPDFMRRLKEAVGEATS